MARIGYTHLTPQEPLFQVEAILGCPIFCRLCRAKVEERVCNCPWWSSPTDLGLGLTSSGGLFSEVKCHVPAQRLGVPTGTFGAFSVQEQCRAGWWHGREICSPWAESAGVVGCGTCCQNEQSALSQGQHSSRSLKISKSFLSTAGIGKMASCGTDPNPTLQPALPLCEDCACSPSTSLHEQIQRTMSFTTAVLRPRFPCR